MKAKLQSIKRKSLLYKSNVEYADYGLNHVEGCSHGCTYPCYAMMMKKRCGSIKSYEDWIQPKIVLNALELLDKEIPRLKDKIKYVYLCFSTDPFMYKVQEVEDLTLKILQRLNKDNIKSVLITKGTYPVKLTSKSIYSADNEHGATVVSLSEKFQKRFEPFSAPIRERIKAIKNLHEAGLKTWVSMEPYPTPNIINQDIREILNEISFVDKIVFGKWNYNGQTSRFYRSGEFYNSMALKVIKFCDHNGIEVHIKKGTISLDHNIISHSLDKELLSSYLVS